LEAAIFDVYGTFDDSDEARRNAFNTAFREFGLDWTGNGVSDCISSCWPSPAARKASAITAAEPIPAGCRQQTPKRLSLPFASARRACIAGRCSGQIGATSGAACYAPFYPKTRFIMIISTARNSAVMTPPARMKSATR